MSSLKKIIDEMETLCDAHDQIRTFEYGEFLDIIKSNSIEYTCCMMNVVQSPIQPENNKHTLSIDLMVMDAIFKDRSNNTDVENTTLLILRDLIGVMWHSKRWQTLGDMTGISIPQKFIEKGADLVTGWGVTVNFDLRVKYGYCDIPVTGYNYDE